MINRFSTRSRPEKAPSPEKAGEFAVSALAYMAGDPECIGAFMTQSGLGPQDLRAAAGSPGFLAAVLDYLCGQEQHLMAFAANEGLTPEAVDLARQVLAGPGGEWSP